MKIFRHITLLLISLATVYSCSDDDFDRTPLLEISKNAIDFTREATTENVKVTINDGDEFYHVINTTGENYWLTANKTQEGLEVVALSNSTLKTRTATIEVYLKKGNLTKKINVTQESGDGQAFITPSETNLSISNRDQEITVYVESNIDWEATLLEPEITWMTIAEQTPSKLTLKVAENTDINGRASTIKLFGSGVSNTILVAQDRAMYYDFPLLTIGYNYEGEESERGIKYPYSFGDVNKFERERGSTLTESMNLGLYYSTKSPIFPTVGYGGYSLIGGGYIPSIKMATLINLPLKPFELLEDPDFVEYMTGEGFEFAWRNNTSEIATYWDKERQIALQFINDGGDFGDRLTFSHARTKPNDPDNQTDAFQTFDTIPEAFMGFGDSVDDIFAWELAKGSTISFSNEELLIFVPDPNKEPLILERAYFLDSSTLGYIQMAFSNLNNAFYFTGNAFDDRAYSLTKEFVDLMHLGDYEPLVDENLPNYCFYNASLSILYLVYVERYVDEGYLPRLSMQIYAF